MNKKYLIILFSIFIVVYIGNFLNDNTMARKSRLSSFNKQNKNTSRVNNKRSIVDSNRNVSPLYSWTTASELLRRTRDSTRVVPQSLDTRPSKISDLIQKLSERRDDIKVDSISRGAKRTHDSREQQDVFPLTPLSVDR